MPEIPLPVENNYKAISAYLQASAKEDICYYRKVIFIGALGLVVSVGLLILLAHYHGNFWDTMLSIKEYPGILCSLFTMGFGQLEIQIKKRTLYQQLFLLSTEDSLADEHAIEKKYSELTWQEFQERIKNP